MSKAVVTYAALDAPSQSIQIESLDTGAGVDSFAPGNRKAIVTFAALDLPLSGSFTPVSSLESGSGTDTIAAPAAILSSDTAVGTEALSIPSNSVFTVSDTGAGSDALSLNALIIVRDHNLKAAGGLVYLFGQQTTARGRETLSVFQVVSATSVDSGVGLETILVAAQVAVADTSSVDTENFNLTANLPTTDSGTAVEDSALLAAGIISADAATDTEVFVVGQIGNPSIAESGAGTENLFVDVGVVSDIGSASETLLQAYATTVADTGSGTEHSMAPNVGSSDTGSGTEASATSAQITSTQQGTGIIVLQLGTRSAINSFDFGGGVDAVSRVGPERGNIFLDENTDDSLLAVGVEGGTILEVE